MISSNFDNLSVYYGNNWANNAVALHRDAEEFFASGSNLSYAILGEDIMGRYRFDVGYRTDPAIVTTSDSVITVETTADLVIIPEVTDTIHVLLMNAAVAAGKKVFANIIASETSQVIKMIQKFETHSVLIFGGKSNEVSEYVANALANAQGITVEHSNIHLPPTKSPDNISGINFVNSQPPAISKPADRMLIQFMNPHRLTYQGYFLTVAYGDSIDYTKYAMDTAVQHYKKNISVVTVNQPMAIMEIQKELECGKHVIAIVRALNSYHAKNVMDHMEKLCYEVYMLDLPTLNYSTYDATQVLSEITAYTQCVQVSDDKIEVRWNPSNANFFTKYLGQG